MAFSFINFGLLYINAPNIKAIIISNTSDTNRELLKDIQKHQRGGLSGKPLKAKMIKILEKLYNEKIILDHGMEVGSELANVLSGGDTNIKKLISEDEMYNLELESFMKLIETKKTQERIKHTLNTGKLLVN